MICFTVFTEVLCVRSTKIISKCASIYTSCETKKMLVFYILKNLFFGLAWQGTFEITGG